MQMEVKFSLALSPWGCHLAIIVGNYTGVWKHFELQQLHLREEQDPLSQDDLPKGVE